MGLSKIIHVAHITLQPTTGMGRIACEWQAAAGRKEIEFIHIGKEEVGPVAHRLLFPLKARKIAERLDDDRTVLLIHEPCAWAFMSVPRFKVAFSHGIELRGADIASAHEKISLKSKLTRPVLRWLGKRGLQAMDSILASNTDDRDYLVEKSIMERDGIRIFRNGIDYIPPNSIQTSDAPERQRTVVFNASWLPRKGTDTLIKAAMRLFERGIRLRWLLIGTVKPDEQVLASWPEALRGDITIVRHFQREDEIALLSRGEIFVLPSFFEGQPLSLLQAMAAGLCCIASDCCGQKDLIQHRQNGLLFIRGKDEELADLIQQALSDPSLRLEMARNARASMSTRTWTNAADEVMLWLQACSL